LPTSSASGWPLIEAVKRGFRESTKGDRTSTWLFVADRLLRQPPLEPRWFAFGMLERTIADEPERTWQLVRRPPARRRTGSPVDALAHVAGKGILNETYRWAELEQLVYSPSRWERPPRRQHRRDDAVRRPPPRPRGPSSPRTALASSAS
jgi:hypothetical protein